jgi:hypothetical protein
MGFLSFLGKIAAPVASIAAAPFTAGTSLSWLPAALGAGGAALGSMGEASAQNRGERLAALLEQDKLRLLAEQDRRTSESDAMRKLAQTAYLRGGGYQAPATPRTITLGGMQRELPSFGFGPRAASEAQMSAASDLERELLARLSGPGFQLSDYSREMKPGIGERLAGIFGPALGVTAVGMDRYQRSRKPTGTTNDYSDWD